MSTFLDKLNLRPQERRLVVIAAIVVFVVINVWFVWPKFGDLGRAQQKKRDAETTLQQFKKELARHDEYQRQKTKLENLGHSVASEAQSLELAKEVSRQAIETGVQVQRYDPTTRATIGKPNAFFEERGLIITVLTGEKELVDFLYNLGVGKSLIRVYSMSLQPDPSRTRLAGSLTLIESFQKAQPKRSIPAPPAPGPSRPTNAPAAAPAPATSAPGARPSSSPPRPTRATPPPQTSTGKTNVSQRVTQIPRRPVPTQIKTNQ